MGIQTLFLLLVSHSFGYHSANKILFNGLESAAPDIGITSVWLVNHLADSNLFSGLEIPSDTIDIKLVWLIIHPADRNLSIGLKKPLLLLVLSPFG